MTAPNEGEHWLNEALFSIKEVASHKSEVDANLVQADVLERIAALNDRQRLSLIELVGTRGRENFLQSGKDVTGVEIPSSLAYLFSSAVRSMILDVVKATDGSEFTCHYCLGVVYPEEVNACRQATLWVSGLKWQNTRLRKYTGAWAHKECVEERAEQPDIVQDELEF